MKLKRAKRRAISEMSVGIPVSLATLLFLGCAPHSERPHALDDAAAASQRASEAMKSDTRSAKGGESSTAAVSDGHSD